MIELIISILSIIKLYNWCNFNLQIIIQLILSFRINTTQANKIVKGHFISNSIKPHAIKILSFRMLILIYYVLECPIKCNI